MTNNSPIRVRFAPSPTGSLHLGGARTALFNFLFARRHGGRFLLRIEDTDVRRSSEAMTSQILNSLQWLGLQWDGEPFFQSAQRHRHTALCRELVRSGSAYPCFCTPEVLAEKRKINEKKGLFKYDRNCLALAPSEAERRIADGQPYVIRFRVPDGQIVFDDLIHGRTLVRNEEIDDFVILRSDGTPVYQIAVVSDDREMRITHVIRGDDHLSNTPKQILLYEALSWPVPRFAHVPLIWGEDRRRLSKRHGATSIEAYRRLGFLPDALANYLALLGWSPGGDEELLPLRDLIQRFSLEQVSKKPAIFDSRKLEWLNGLYIRSKPVSELAANVIPLLVEAGLVKEGDSIHSSDYVRRFVELMRDRVRTLNEFVSSGLYFFQDPAHYNPDAVEKHFMKSGVEERLSELISRLSGLKNWKEGAIEKAVRNLAEESAVGAGKVIHPVRLALTGVSASPGLFEMMTLLGRDTVIRRLNRALAFIQTARNADRIR